MIWGLSIWRGWVGRASWVVGRASWVVRRGSCVVGRASWVVRRGSCVVGRASVIHAYSLAKRYFFSRSLIYLYCACTISFRAKYFAFFARELLERKQRWITNVLEKQELTSCMAAGSLLVFWWYRTIFAKYNREKISIYRGFFSGIGFRFFSNTAKQPTPNFYFIKWFLLVYSIILTIY